MNHHDAWRAVSTIAASQHGAFNRNQARTASLDARRLRAGVKAGRVEQRLSDVFVFTNSPATFRQGCAVASLAGAVISHRSAAVLHDFDGFTESRSHIIEVSFERDRRRHLPGVTAHSWTGMDADDIATVDGIRVTSKARTLFQLGRVCTRDQVEIALDSALRKGAPPEWIEQTAVRLWRSGPTGGSTLFDLMYDPRRSGALSESVLEKVIERVLSLPGLPPLVRQYEIATRSGRKRVDLAFPEIRFAIEGHSRRHHFGDRNEQADARREAELGAVGWQAMYVGWALAHQNDALLDLVQATVAERRRLFHLAG